MPLITEMYAFVTSDTAPDDEGIPAFMNGPILMPMTGADMARVQDLMPIAQRAADESGKQIRIYRFSQKEQIGVIEPRRPKQ